MSEDTTSALPDPAETAFQDAVALRRPFFVLIGVLFCIFVAGIYLYAGLAGPWVDSLDDQVGLIVATRARDLAMAGLTDEAVATYRQALKLRFNDPRQQIWKMQEFVDLLIKEARYEEASDQALALSRLDMNRGTVRFRRIQNALRSENRYEEAIALAHKWYDSAKAEGLMAAGAWGALYMGLNYRDTEHSEKAAAAALEAFSMNATVETASVGARILRDLGKKREALPLLDYVIAHDDGALRREALSIKAKLKQ